MGIRHALVDVVVVAVLVSVAAPVAAQPLGSFTWQLQPYCNRVTVNVRQDGSVYTLDGTDDLCGAPQKAPLVGLAAPNPDGSIGFGLNIISPTGQSIPVQARISISSLSGTWSDAAGNGGAFAFGANTGGGARPSSPASGGDITGVAAGTGLTGGGPAGDVSLAVNTSVIQSRVTTGCPAGQAIRSINENGTAICQASTGAGGGDITAVTAGAGLTGGGATGDVTLDVIFGGDGAANAAARADHEHLTNPTTVSLGLNTLGANGVNNVAVGVEALRFSTTGSNNTAVGFEAARAVTDTSAVTAVGSQAFRVTTAFGNTGLGAQAGAATTTGLRNTAVGAAALFSNVTGSDNVAVGRSALILATASDNTAVGAHALDAATNGTSNTAVGRNALGVLTTGSNNVALGRDAGLAATTGSRMTLVGDSADAGSGALVNATAIGALARVDQDNSVVLGSINGVNGATSDTRVGIGTTAPEASLDVVHHEGSGFTGTFTRFASGNGPVMRFRTARGTSSAPTAVLANDNLLFLSISGHTGTGFTTQRAFLVTEASEPWSDTANGTRWKFSTTANGTTTEVERMRIEHNGNVGIGIGETNPLARLHVAGGTVRVDTLGVAGATTLCRNASNEIATCSSSLRYKRDMEAFDGGLNLLGRLRPISFTWRDGGLRDVGFGAEEVAAIDPRLAVFNEAGEVEGVKYDRLTTVLVNAIKELEQRVKVLEAALAASKH